MSYKYMILRVMQEQNWSKAFATQYVMERHYNGMSHGAAVRAAMRSPFVKSHEIPPSVQGY